MTTVPHLRTDPGAPPRSRGARMVGPVALGTAIVGTLSYTALVDPHGGGFYPLCPLYAVTGLWCPGCGTIRALHALVHGDLAGAIDFNVLVPPLLVVLVVLTVGWGAARWRGRALPDPPTWLPVTAGVLVLAFGIARNLPGLEWLAP